MNGRRAKALRKYCITKWLNLDVGDQPVINKKLEDLYGNCRRFYQATKKAWKRRKR